MYASLAIKVAVFVWKESTGFSLLVIPAGKHKPAPLATAALQRMQYNTATAVLFYNACSTTLDSLIYFSLCSAVTLTTAVMYAAHQVALINLAPRRGEVIVIVVCVSE